MQERIQEIIVLTRQAWAAAPPQRRSDWLWPAVGSARGPRTAQVEAHRDSEHTPACAG